MSTTALPPNLSPAYQPRSFRTASPYPAPPPTSTTSSSAIKTGRSLSAHRLEHPLPSRPAAPLPPVPGNSSRVNAEPISGPATASISNTHHAHRPPPSPAMSAFDERRGRSSGLRHEVKRGDMRQEGKRRPSREEEAEEALKGVKKEAKDILKLLRRLPAPLPEFLPSTYLPPKNPNKKQKLSATEGSFTDYVHAQRTNSSSSASASASSSSSSPTNATHPLGNSESSLGKRRRTPSPLASTRIPTSFTASDSVGLGLGLMDMPIPKKSKSSMNLASESRSNGKSTGSAAMTPSASLPLGQKVNGPRSPELLRTASNGNVHANGRGLTPTMESGYKPRAPASIAGSPPAGESKMTWNRAKWGEAAQQSKARGVILKRHGDAHNGNPKAGYTHVKRDDLLGLLRLTDAVLMYLYSDWANEQATGRVRGTPYSESEPLRTAVRKGWEKLVSLTCEPGQEKDREMAKGMIGLMYLIEAVINYHLATQTIYVLEQDNKRISQRDRDSRGSAGMSRTANGSMSGPLSAQAAGPGVNNGTGPSPTSDGSPPDSLLNPSPHSSFSNTNPEIPPEISMLIANGARQSSNASQHLLNARHHLPLSRLRGSFPETFQAAISCELADEALPAPNDTIGAARKVDIDHLDMFVWPIELGMCAPAAHLSVFGRRLVQEYASRAGKEWDVKLGA